ncbi:MAG: hypothetical protein ACLVL7_06595 [Anaerotruncus massiliensis (ex Togo et al. 2019)]
MTKNRPLFFSLAGCAAVCLILRVVLKLTAVDPATGFYEGGGALPLVFNILLGVSVLLLLAAGYLSGRRMRGASVTFTIPLRALSIAAGAALFCWTLLRLKELPKSFPPIILSCPSCSSASSPSSSGWPCPGSAPFFSSGSRAPGPSRSPANSALLRPSPTPGFRKTASTSRAGCTPCG